MWTNQSRVGLDWNGLFLVICASGRKSLLSSLLPQLILVGSKVSVTQDINSKVSSLISPYYLEIHSRIIYFHRRPLKFIQNVNLNTFDIWENGLIWVKEEGRTGFSQGWQGCSDGFPEGEARGKSRGAALLPREASDLPEGKSEYPRDHPVGKFFQTTTQDFPLFFRFK